MKYICTILLSLLSGISFAQHGVTELAADICPGPMCSGYPYAFTTYKGDLLFSASTDSGTAFYKYNTVQGLQGPFVYSSFPYHVYSSIALNDTVYFLGMTYGPNSVMGLMKWDGQSAPQLVQPLSLWAVFGYVRQITTLNNKLYFVGGIDSSRYTVSEYDPATGALKAIAKSISPINALAIFKNKILYAHYTDSNNYCLFSYNPQTGRTERLLKDRTYISSYMEDSFLEVDGVLYFMAATVTPTYELCRYDGNSAPVVVSSMNNAASVFYAHSLAYAAGGIYHQVYDPNVGHQLWRYNIATGTNTVVRTIENNKRLFAYNLFAYRDKIFMNIYANDTNEQNRIYIYNPQTDSSSLMPLPAGTSPYFIYQYRYLYDDAAYMCAETADYGLELFRYTEAPEVQAKATLYPNPTTGNAFIKIHSDTLQALAISIHDAVGHELLYQNIGDFHKGEHNIEVPTAHLAAGVYIITLRNYRKVLMREKLVKL